MSNTYLKNLKNWNSTHQAFLRNAQITNHFSTNQMFRWNITSNNNTSN